MKEPTDIDLLMIGKTGNGKSATGNSILRRRAFKSRSSTTSVTLNVDYEVSEFKGRVIKVVDGPGVGDTRMNTERAVNLVMEKMEYAIVANPRGYHAFLLVVRFGGRFTEEDHDTIVFLKKIFGDDFVRVYCILVLTCGDNFENESEDTGKSLKEWCDEQDGVFKELVNECNNRVILFDNVTKDQTKKADQIDRLLKMVDALSSQGHRYTDANFALARETRDRVIVDAQKPRIEEETMKETSLILLKLQEVELLKDLELKIKPLEELQIRADNLYHKISSRDRGTGALHDLCSAIKSIQRSVSDEIKFCFKMMDEREKIRRYEEETRRKYEDQIKKQREEFDKRLIEKERVSEERLKDEQRVLEERRQYEKEQERQKREIEEKSRKEREEIERQFQKKLQEELVKQKKIHNDLEGEYRKAKEENDEGFFSKVVCAVSWPIRKLAGLFY